MEEEAEGEVGEEEKEVEEEKRREDDDADDGLEAEGRDDIEGWVDEELEVGGAFPRLESLALLRDDLKGLKLAN